MNQMSQGLIMAAGEPRISRTREKPIDGQKMASIIAAVAQETLLTIAMLIGDRRSRPIVQARHYAMWRVAKETGASLTQIGRAFGGRDHTSVLHGIRRYEQRNGIKSPENV